MFAKQLREILATVNKTRLARELGCHRDTLAKWLSGDRVPTVVLLLSLCQYLYPDEWEQAFTVQHIDTGGQMSYTICTCSLHGRFGRGWFLALLF